VADVNVTWYQPLYSQAGLSGGGVVSIPSGAFWRRMRIMPYNLISVENPISDECQIWPQYGLAQDGVPTS
jgi:hypothetical protein